MQRRVIGIAIAMVALSGCSTPTTSTSATTHPEAASNSPATSADAAPATDAPVVASVAPVAGDTEAGSRENPVAVGSPVRIGDWIVTVTGANPDATDTVLSENPFNDPPAQDRQFFVVSFEATYVGDDSGTFWIDLNLKPLGASNVAYESFDAYCGVIPNDISDSGETFPSGTITGDLCWSVTADDAGTLLLIAEPTFSFNDDRTFLAVRADQGSVPDAPVVASVAPVAGDTEAGSRENPVAVGSPVRIGDWIVTVTGANPDATDTVLSENPFNDPPAQDRQFFVVSFEATYVGDDSGTFWIDLNLKPLGASNVAYESFDAYCGVIPNDISDSGETFPSGTITGDLCWSVTADDAGTLLLIAEPTFSFNDDRTFLAVRSS